MDLSGPGIWVNELCLQVFSEKDLEKQERDVMMYSLLFVGLGVISLVAMFLQVIVVLIR